MKNYKNNNLHKFCLYTVARAFNQRIFDNFVLIVHKVQKFIGTVFHFLNYTKSSSKIKKKKKIGTRNVRGRISNVRFLNFDFKSESLLQHIY